VEGRHPVMITPEEYDCLNYNKEKKRQIRRNEVEQLPLKKHLICSNCNQKLTGYSASNRKNLFYYKCRTNGCKLNIRSETVHDSYYEFLKKFSFNKNHLPQLRKMLDEVFKMVNKSNKKLQKEIKTRITKLEEERKLAIRNYNTDTETNGVLLELIEFCDNDLDDLREQLSQIKVGVKEIRNNILEALNFINELPVIWSSCDYVFKLKLQELVFPDGIWFDKSSNKLTPLKINPIFGLIGVFQTKVDDYRKIDDFQSTDKYCRNSCENKGKVRTSDFIKNMLVNPNKIWGYGNRDEVVSNKKIHLVVLLSDRSNNLGGKLYDSMTEIIRFMDLDYSMHSIVKNLKK